MDTESVPLQPPVANLWLLELLLWSLRLLKRPEPQTSEPVTNTCYHDRPQNPLQGATEKIGGYAREPEARSTRGRFRLPPAYGRYSRRAYKARVLFLFAYR